ncbi:hypothetical protein SASPL_152659 [Salvia splendens]|uniref:Uncharacterized protein n=1 Tax=Salvia splendens TaxID=180675 RepID=A0A8X8W415_SALSN|nr:hypothetical protein SASPL_152659 [Salvia splendens]
MNINTQIIYCAKNSISKKNENTYNNAISQAQYIVVKETCDYKHHKMMGNIFSYRHQHNTRAARRRDMPLRMAFPTSVGCPLGATGPDAVELLPVLLVGTLIGGRGGSITLSSVRMGLGASAGGIA